MAKIIKPNTEYTSYDTSSADVAVTLTATTGKTYQVKNTGTGGYALTVTYGSDSYKFNDGDSGTLTYDGSGWATQFSTVGGDVSLFSAQKYISRKTTIVSASGRYVLAEFDPADYEQCEGYLDVLVSGSSRVGTARVYFRYSDKASGHTVSGLTVKYEDIDNSSSVPIEGVGILYADVLGAGCKILCDIDVSTTAYVTCILTQTAQKTSIDAIQNSGMVLVAATITGNTTTPDGSTGTYLEAGTVFKKTNVYEYTMPNIKVHKYSDDSIRMAIDFGVQVKPDASTITFTFTGDCYLYDYTGDTNRVNLNGLTLTQKALDTSGHMLYARFESVGSFSALAYGPLDLRAQDFKATLS